MPAVENAELMQRLTELAEKAAQGSGIEVVEVDLRGAGKARLLRVYIDKPGGVTHGDCEFVSQRLGELIDQEDAVPGESYTLEISSPGVERKLSKPRDFERVVGQKVRVLVREPVEGQLRWEGKLAGIAGGVLAIEPEPGSSVQVTLDNIRKANLKFEW